MFLLLFYEIKLRLDQREFARVQIEIFAHFNVVNDHHIVTGREGGD